MLCFLWDLFLILCLASKPQFEAKIQLLKGDKEKVWKWRILYFIACFLKKFTVSKSHVFHSQQTGAQTLTITLTRYIRFMIYRYILPVRHHLVELFLRRLSILSLSCRFLSLNRLVVQQLNKDKLFARQFASI